MPSALPKICWPTKVTRCAIRSWHLASGKQAENRSTSLIARSAAPSRSPRPTDEMPPFITLKFAAFDSFKTEQVWRIVCSHRVIPWSEVNRCCTTIFPDPDAQDSVRSRATQQGGLSVAHGFDRAEETTILSLSRTGGRDRCQWPSARKPPSDQAGCRGRTGGRGGPPRVRAF